MVTNGLNVLLYAAASVEPIVQFQHLKLIEKMPALRM
jgi:hypothetical protein